MKKLMILVVVMLMSLSVISFAGSSTITGGGDLFCAAVSTYSVIGASGAGIGSATATMVWKTYPRNAGKYGNIAIQKVVLSNGTTVPYVVSLYDYTTLGTTTTITQRVAINVPAKATNDGYAILDFTVDNMPIIKNILIRKASGRSSGLESGTTGEVTGYILYR